jgi:hypothetical protein
VGAADAAAAAAKRAQAALGIQTKNAATKREAAGPRQLARARRGGSCAAASGRGEAASGCGMAASGSGTGGRGRAAVAKSPGPWPGERPRHRPRPCLPGEGRLAARVDAQQHLRPLKHVPADASRRRQLDEVRQEALEWVSGGGWLVKWRRARAQWAAARWRPLWARSSLPPSATCCPPPGERA